MRTSRRLRSSPCGTSRNDHTTCGSPGCAVRSTRLRSATMPATTTEIPSRRPSQPACRCHGYRITDDAALPFRMNPPGVVEVQPHRVPEAFAQVEAAPVQADLCQPRPHRRRRRIDPDRLGELHCRVSHQSITGKPLPALAFGGAPIAEIPHGGIQQGQRGQSLERCDHRPSLGRTITGAPGAIVAIRRPTFLPDRSGDATLGTTVGGHCAVTGRLSAARG